MSALYAGWDCLGDVGYPLRTGRRRRARLMSPYDTADVDGSARLALARARFDVAASTTFDGLDRAIRFEARGDVDGLEVVQPKPAQ